jgi:hypothetical protein
MECALMRHSYPIDAAASRIRFTNKLEDMPPAQNKTMFFIGTLPE